MPIKSVKDILTTLVNASSYTLNSDYEVVWAGPDAGTLNAYNDVLESMNIPAKTINTNDSRTANSLSAKIASDVTFEDFEVSWRMPRDFGVFYSVKNWMNKAKGVGIDTGVGNLVTVKTGFYDEYCSANSCQIKTAKGLVCRINGLYPINSQPVQFSSEGGEVLKYSVTFAVRFIEYSDDVAAQVLGLLPG